jgi:hypothetical protein
MTEIATMKRSLYEWDCPMCNAHKQSTHCPEATLTTLARVLLALNLPIAAALGVLVFSEAPGIFSAHFILWPLILMSLIALSLRRVVKTTCPRCGYVAREYRRSPINWKAIFDPDLWKWKLL